ncbi:FHA domain-containing protein [Herbiconiux sp.]|uniref:FHA domain-containing protein n=1 Tax=Herbiconiux sp. TaxID=1871186 RepID=UPI0025BBCCAE|nr:FHA domain-containing protein [Herbiconiux sp.]
MGSLRFVPADENGPAEHWVVLAAWPGLVLLPGGAPGEIVQQVWDALGAEDPSLEAVVSSIPLRGATQIDSFAVVRFTETESADATSWTATVVVRGTAAVDLLSVGGSRRFGSGGAQPWALAEFAAVTGVTMGETPPVPESRLRLPEGARRLDHGVARASRVLWVDSAERLADGVVVASVPSPGPGGAAPENDDTVMQLRPPLAPDPRAAPESRAEARAPAEHEPQPSAEEASTEVPPAPRYVFRIGDGPRTDLAGPVVIGRRPQPRLGYSTESPVLIAVESPEGEVSQNHVELAPVGRTVVITDLRSTNGTRVSVAGSAPRRLRQGDSVVATGSAIVEIGDGNVIHISSRDRENTETTV